MGCIVKQGPQQSLDDDLQALTAALDAQAQPILQGILQHAAEIKQKSASKAALANGS